MGGEGAWKRIFLPDPTTSLIATGELIQPLNHSVVFLKEKEVILTSDIWCVAIDLGTGTYEEVISAIHGDLLLVERQRKEFTSISELKQIETLLNDLELKLHSFRQILPRLNLCRGLINLGGNILRILFGTATVADVEQLQETLDSLQSRNDDIVHSLSDQLTYVKKLDTVTKIKVDTLTNLSSIVKDTIVQSHDRFQQLTREIMWLNVTIYNQSEIYMRVRQLEFALLWLTQQIDELVATI